MYWEDRRNCYFKEWWNVEEKDEQIKAGGWEEERMRNYHEVRDNVWLKEGRRNVSERERVWVRETELAR